MVNLRLLTKIDGDCDDGAECGGDDGAECGGDDDAMPKHSVN
jgi:hypothetical protein